MDQEKKWKIKTFAIGGGIGLLVGLLASFFIIKRAEQEAELAKLSPAEGVQLGLGVLGLLRLIAK